MVKKLADLLILAQKKGPVKIVVTAAHDLQVLESIKQAVSYNLIIPTFTGHKDEIIKLADSIEFNISTFSILEASDDQQAAERAVDYIKNNHADIIMKGLLPTKVYIKAIIDPIKGIEHQKIMSHIAFMEVSNYHKIIAITDVALNISPSVQAKGEILKNALHVFKVLDKNKIPKVAVICPIESVNPKIESTVHASELVKIFSETSSCIIEGPLAFDNAISADSASHKGIYGKVVGDADLLICHNIDVGNVLYKSLVFFAGAQSAAVVTGASVPIVLTSRSDSAISKLYSIALASLLI